MGPVYSFLQLSFAYLLSHALPQQSGPLTHWVHFVEATIGLNVVSSIYRRVGDGNEKWLAEYARRTRSVLLLRFERAGPKYASLMSTLVVRLETRRREQNDGSITALLTISLFVAMLGLAVLYFDAANPGTLLSPNQQRLMVLILAAPIPFALLYGVWFRTRTRMAKMWVLRQTYPRLFRLWFATFLGSISIRFDWISARMMQAHTTATRISAWAKARSSALLTRASDPPDDESEQ